MSGMFFSETQCTQCHGKAKATNAWHLELSQCNLSFTYNLYPTDLWVVFIN